MDVGPDAPAERPWEELPQSLATLIRSHSAALGEAIIATLATRKPTPYSRPLEGAFGRGVRRGIQGALSQFAKLVAAGGEALDASERELWRQLGREELRDGRSVDVLVSAVQLGARALWRGLRVPVADAGYAEPVQLALGEAIYAYADAVTSEVIAGYVEEQETTATERGLARRRLVAVLLKRDRPSELELEAAASEAGWPLPERAAIVLAAGTNADELAGRIGHGTVAAPVDRRLCAVLSDPDAPGVRRRLEASLRGRAAALGPSAPVDELRTSYARASLALELAERGALRPTSCSPRRSTSSRC